MYRSTNPNYCLTTPELIPHCFDQLHTERMYLLGVLQEENEKATKYLRRLQPLEEMILLNEPLYLRGALKKQLGWLRSRIRETNRQEKVILMRLGHLTYEIQSQQRWNQFQQELPQYFPDPIRNSNFNPRANQSGSKRMNPLSPEFYSQGYVMPYHSLCPRQNALLYRQDAYLPFHLCSSEIAAPTYDGEEYPFPKHVVVEFDSAVEYDSVQRPPLTHRPSSMSSADCDTLATKTAFGSSPQSKRRSLPGIICVDKTWPDSLLEQTWQGRMKRKVLFRLPRK